MLIIVFAVQEPGRTVITEILPALSVNLPPRVQIRNFLRLFQCDLHGFDFWDTDKYMNVRVIHSISEEYLFLDNTYFATA